MDTINPPDPASSPNSKAAPELPRAAILAPYRFRALRDDPRLTTLTNFAAELCGTPTALVSLIGDNDQLFIARTGFAAQEPPLEHSFCSHAMHRAEVMVVLDAREDPAYASNPLVTGEPYIRFYAGAPLRTAEGHPLGSLCVIDAEPHAELTGLQRRGLETLAQSAMALFESHRGLIAKAAETAVARDERDDQQQRFAILADAMPQMVWSTPPDGLTDYFNARWYEFTGAAFGSTEGANWAGVFHPDDQERAWAAWNNSVATGEPYEIEYRLKDSEGAYRWVLGRALPMRDDEGRITRWFGTCTDIHEQKLALEEREIISQELSHRIKNIFSVISGLIGLSSREQPELKPVADRLRERVMALGTAHDFVRPHSKDSRPVVGQTSLRGMVGKLLAPYQSSDGTRFTMSGIDPEIDDRSATPLALLFHELATNAAKYGALASPAGRVTLSCAEADGQTSMRWRESGARLSDDPGGGPQGFGSRLIAMSVERQLGGKVERRWHPDGLEVVVTLPTTAMRRI